MNIWSLDKNQAIKRVLLRLEEQFGKNSFIVSETPVLDDNAIRLFAADDSGLSVYLYTHGQIEGRYGIHLEYPLMVQRNISQSVESQEDINFEQLSDLLQMHFDIAPIHS